MTLLVVNADDFGLTEATSAEILRCHRDGIVTSTSLLTLAPGFESSAPLLRDHPEVGVGVHLALVGEDPPLLTASEIPTLVDRDGRLPIDWRQFLRRAVAGHIDRGDVEREWRAQVERARDVRPTLTHLDSHQHLHQWPPLWRIVVDLAQQAGVGAIRTTAGPGVAPVPALGRLARRRARRAGLATTDGFVGFEDSGHLDEPALVRALSTLPSDGSIELGCHPGAATDDDRDRYRWGFRWADESAALRSSAARAVLDERGIRLGTFADVAAPHT